MTQLDVRNQDVLYNDSVRSIAGLNGLAVSLIANLNLSQFQQRQPKFTFVVIPSDDFLRVTKIPENFGWATTCSRGIWRQDREDAVVVSSIHDCQNLGPSSDIGQLTETQADVLREAVHEHLPTLRDTYLPFSSASALPISEAMDELVPRYILGMQDYMPKSTQFLVDLPEDKLLTIQDLWDGFSRHSSDPIRTNHAYGSAFLFGIALIKKLENNGEFNKSEALSLWLDLMVKAKSPIDVVEKFAKYLDVDTKLLYSDKVFQKEGQELLRLGINL